MLKINIVRNRLGQSAVGLLVIDLIFFGSLNPSRVAQFTLVIGFILLMMNLYLLSYGVTSLIRLYGLPLKRKKRLSLYCAIFLGVIIALQSIGELSPRDIFVALLLAIISYGYIAYASMTRQKSTHEL